jgi:hypothetical protein
MWAPVFFRKRFFPFTSTIGRSEGLNSYFKTLVHPGDSVFNFVQQYELCQNLNLDREDNSGFIMETTSLHYGGGNYFITIVLLSGMKQKVYFIVATIES